MVSENQWKALADRLERRQFPCSVDNSGVDPMVKCNYYEMNPLPSNQVISATIRTMGKDDDELWVIVNGRHNSNNQRYNYAKQQQDFMECESKKFKDLKGFTSVQKRSATYGASVKGTLPTPNKFTEDFKDNISDFINEFAQYITGAKKCTM